jgi:tetratricopeptide (TPR) repeat protein
MAKGDFADASRSYQDSLRYGPESLGTLFNLGIAYERAGQYREALATFSTLLARNPASTAVLLRIGSNQLRLDMQDVALDTFKRVLVLDKSNATALLAAGAICGTKGEFERAVEYSQRAIEVSPESVKAYQNLAIALLRLNRPEEATRVVDAGLAVDPHNEVLNSIKTALAPDQGK